MKIAQRFVDESLALHWQVDETKESFSRLMEQLEVKSNFKPYFEEAVEEMQRHFGSERLKKGITVADIGSGICWTSAILANLPYVKHVYSVEPSAERLRHAECVFKHLRAPEGKVTILNGNFEEIAITQKIDLFVLCASFHHCYDKYIQELFRNIRKLLNPEGRVLIANEHYVNSVWVIKRFISYFKHLGNKKKLGFDLKNLRSPNPFDGEHWRTIRELKDIFKEEGFTAEFYLHKGDLCKDKPTFYHRAGWRYYYAILRKE
ncbi:MAG: class I SAM-dependent methyltransferase [Nitrospirae bacterium]|nr:class I SAM-dependent methyltransferase [Nitrospirota bacterium]